MRKLISILTILIAVSLVGSSIDAKTVSKKKKKPNTTQTVGKKKTSKKSNKVSKTTKKTTTIKKENSLKQESSFDKDVTKPTDPNNTKSTDLNKSKPAKQNESKSVDKDDNKVNNTESADDNSIDPWKRFKKFYVGISYGLGMSNYTNVDHGKVIFSMDAGLIAGYGFNDHIFIESGLKYS